MNHNFRYFAYLAVLTILLSVVAKFDGIVTVQVTPIGLQVQLNNHSVGCPIDTQLPQIQPKQLDRELA